MHVVKSKDDEINNWFNNVVECAKNFSYAMEERFVGSMMRAEHFLPKESRKELAGEVNAIFIDYLVGTTVAILCHGNNANPEIEEHIVEDVRRRFAEIRKLRGQPHD